MNYLPKLCLLIVMAANFLVLVGCDKKDFGTQASQELGKTEDRLTEKSGIERNMGDIGGLADDAPWSGVDAEGRTPLHVAVASKKSSVVRELIEQDASLDAKTEKGNAPLHLAIIAGDTLVVETLLKSGADVNQSAAGGYTALHFVCLPPIHSSIQEKIRLTLARLLLFYRAQVNLVSNDGRTPLHIAAQWGSLELVDLLLANGASAIIRDQNGQTPADAALAAGLLDIAERIRGEQQGGL